MKSLVALLDRKKRDRANTLVPASLPSSLPPPTSPQLERLAVPPTNSRRHGSSDFLRPQLQHRATSNPDLPQRSQFHELETQSRRRSPVQSVAYHNDPDDDTLADPFAAASPIKLNTTATSNFHVRSGRAFVRPNLIPDPTVPTSQGMLHSDPPIWTNRAERKSSVTSGTVRQASFQTGAGDNGLTSAPVGGMMKKGGWLRERRSFTSFLRPQAAVSTEPVPQLPQLDARIPELKNSFFSRGRSGSMPPKSQGAERAHIPQRASVGQAQAPIQSQTPGSPQSRDACGDTVAYGEVAQIALASPVVHDSFSPDSWVRVGGFSYNQSSSDSATNARRRAMSVPAIPRRSGISVLPISSNQQTIPPNPKATKTKQADMSSIHRPQRASERQAGSKQSAHGLRSASVSVPGSHDSNCGPLESNLRRRPSLKHFKKSSVSVSEGHSADLPPRKSALKRGSAQTRQILHARQDIRITGPIAARTGAPPELPTPTSEGGLRHLCMVPTSGRRPTGTIISLSSPPTSTSDTSMSTTGTSNTLSTTGSLGSILKRHGLAGDSRALPVLDNIWGSFVSETAFGSLPSSPTNSTTARGQVAKCQKPESPVVLSRRRQWNSVLQPPCSPPVAGLPPVPANPAPALVLPLDIILRRKKRHGFGKEDLLLTPPISPTEGAEFHELSVSFSASTSSGSLLGTSQSGISETAISIRDVSPEFTRSASSPVIRSLSSPIPSRAPNASTRSWLPVDHPRSGSSSQCTLVPGTPFGLPFSSENVPSSYLESSSGVCRAPGIGKPAGNMQSLSPASARTAGSEISLSMFPSVPLNKSRPNTRGQVVHGKIVAEGEEHLPTPPVTPAWFARMFDTSSEINQDYLEVEEARDKIPLGSLAQMSRGKRSHNPPSCTSDDESSDGVVVPRAASLLPRRKDWRFGDATIDEKHMGRKF